MGCIKVSRNFWTSEKDIQTCHKTSQTALYLLLHAMPSAATMMTKSEFRIYTWPPHERLIMLKFNLDLGIQLSYYYENTLNKTKFDKYE